MAYYRKLKSSRIEKIRDILDLGILSNKVVLAGGAVSAMINTDLPINDYDIFFVDIQNIHTENPLYCCKEFLETREKLIQNGFECIFECPNKELFSFRKEGMKVQLITKGTYVDVESLLYSFDFFPCMCAYVNGAIIVPEKMTVRCCKFKRLETHYITYPTSSLRRLIKYHKKGFYPTHNCLKKIAYDIKDTSLNATNMAFYFD